MKELVEFTAFLDPICVYLNWLANAVAREIQSEEFYFPFLRMSLKFTLWRRSFMWWSRRTPKYFLGLSQRVRINGDMI